MRYLSALRKFNVVLFAILGVMAIIVTGLVGFQQLREYWRYNDEFGEGRKAEASSSITGEKIDAGDRVLTLYSQGRPNDEFKRDLRFVDSRTGSSVRFGANEQQQIYGGQLLGQPHRDQTDNGYGYLGLAKTADRSDGSRFDLVFVRFSDMRSFTLARNVRASDPVELDAKSFSTTVWDDMDRARFILFDSVAGQVVVTKDLEMKGEAVGPHSGPSAPEAKFE